LDRRQEEKMFCTEWYQPFPELICSLYLLGNTVVIRLCRSQIFSARSISCSFVLTWYNLIFRGKLACCV